MGPGWDLIRLHSTQMSKGLNWRFCLHRLWFQVLEPADECVATIPSGCLRDPVFCCCEDAEEGRTYRRKRAGYPLDVEKIVKYPAKVELRR